MLALTVLTNPPISPPQSLSPQNTLLSFSSSLRLKPQTRIPKIPKRFAVFANNNNNNGLNQESKEKEEEQGVGSNGSDDELGKNQRPLFGNIRWGDLLLDPDPNNILAVGLTGVLTWASVQVLLQLVVIALAILVAAVKYSFIAAVLLFILIALL